MHDETMEARVVSVDYGKRLVVLRGPAGHEATVVVGPEVRNFDQIKAGDTVNVLYREDLAIKVRGSSAPLPGIMLSGRSASAAPGELPGAVWANQATRTVQVLGINTATHTVTYRDVDGKVFTIAVQNPADWSIAAQLVPGSLVDVTNVQTIAVGISRS